MNANNTAPTDVSRIPTYDRLKEQHERLTAVRGSILHTTKELALAHSQGQELHHHFQILSGLFVAEKAEREAMDRLLTELEP
jgi:hypothetical protein